MGERGRDWDTDIVGVGTDILGYLVNVTDSKKHASNSCCFNFAVLILNTRAQVTLLIDSIVTEMCFITINNKLGWPPTTCDGQPFSLSRAVDEGIFCI